MALNARLCASKPAIPLAVSAFVSVAGAVAALSMPIDTGDPSDENDIYVHVEFEPGASAGSVDQSLSEYAGKLASVAGIEHVQSTAYRGYGLVLASYDRERTDSPSVSQAARDIEVPHGFAWIQGDSPGERSFELVVAGDDDAECRKTAAQAAEIISSLPFVRQTVLNFKDGPEDTVMTLDRDRAADLGVSFAGATAALRRSIYGPVAYKRLGSGGEMDVRVTVCRDGFPSPRDVASTLVGTESATTRIDSVMNLARVRDASSIARRDRRRVAVVSMLTNPVDPRKAARLVRQALADMPIPAGYSVEFDREALDSAEKLAGMAWSLGAAILLAYMVTAAVTESFGAPLAVLSAVPPSLAVPAVLYRVSGESMNAAVACAFVAVSGMVVNASLLSVEERRARDQHAGSGASAAYALMRKRAGMLLATSGTTIAGALPLLFSSDAGSSMIRSLSFVTATGTAASFFVALTVIPALAVVAPWMFAPCISGKTRALIINHSKERKA